MTEVLLKPKTDLLHDKYAVKLLRMKESREYLIQIISAALKEDIGVIGENFELLDIRVSLNDDMKNSESDVVATSEYGIINVEVNYNDGNKETDNKNMSYVCALYLKELKSGERVKYKNLKKVYQINIDLYDKYKENKFIYTSVLMEEELKIPLRNGFIKIVDINLDFLCNIDYNIVKNSKKDSLERLLYIFVCGEKETLDKLYLGDKLMEKIKNTLFGIKLDKIDDYLYYDKEEYKKNAAFEEGKTAGIDEERKNTLEIAKKLYLKGISKEEIIELFNLTKEEINSIFLQ